MGGELLVAKKYEAKITDKLGEILKRERINAGYTREEIAERTGIGVRHLAAIENEQRMPRSDVPFDTRYRDLCRSYRIS